MDAIQRAATTWGEQGNSNFSFVYAGTTDVSDVADDGINAIIYKDDECPLDLNCGAAAFYHQDGGVFHGFDIVLYSTEGDTGWGIVWSVKEIPDPWDSDLETTTLHELGHGLGLDHGFPGTVMGGCGGSGCSRRALSTDDLDGIQALYGVYSHEGFESDKEYAHPGDTITLRLHYGLAANQDFEVLLSLSGMDGSPMRTLDPASLSGSPGSMSDGTDSRILPINDDFFPVTAHPAIFQEFLGTLDAQGEATATIMLPEGFALLGTNLYLSVVTYDDANSPNNCDSPSCIGDVGVGIHVQVLPEGIPTVSEWGMVAMTRLTLTAGTLVLSRRKIAST